MNSISPLKSSQISSQSTTRKKVYNISASKSCLYCEPIENNGHIFFPCHDGDLIVNEFCVPWIGYSLYNLAAYDCKSC